MPLSEYEQRVLEQLERDLGADPKLGQAMARGPRSRSRLTWAVLGVIGGLGIVLAGAVSQQLWVGITGFALMTLAALWGLLAPSAPRSAPTAAPTTKSSTSGGVKRRAEERFERRREQGDL